MIWKFTLEVPFWNPSATRSKALRLKGMLQKRFKRLHKTQGDAAQDLGFIFQSQTSNIIAKCKSFYTEQNVNQNFTRIYPWYFVTRISKQKTQKTLKRLKGVLQKTKVLNRKRKWSVKFLQIKREQKIGVFFWRFAEFWSKLTSWQRVYQHGRNVLREG